MEFNATFLVSAISFILFTMIMNKIFYKPLENAMYEREEFINNTLSQAKYSSDKADAILKDKDEKLKKTSAESKKFLTEKITEANKYANEVINQAKSKSKLDIDNAKSDLSVKSDELNKEIQPEIKNLASIISSKILGFETKVEDI